MQVLMRGRNCRIERTSGLRPSIPPLGSSVWKHTEPHAQESLPRVPCYETARPEVTLAVCSLTLSCPPSPPLLCRLSSACGRLCRHLAPTASPLWVRSGVTLRSFGFNCHLFADSHSAKSPALTSQWLQSPLANCLFLFFFLRHNAHTIKRAILKWFFILFFVF